MRNPRWESERLRRHVEALAAQSPDLKLALEYGCVGLTERFTGVPALDPETQAIVSEAAREALNPPPAPPRIEDRPDWAYTGWEGLGIAFGSSRHDGAWD